MALIRKSTSELSIKPKMSSQARLAVSAVSGVGLLAALYFTYQAGVAGGHQQVGEDQALISQLNSTIVSLRNELKVSQQNLIIAQRHRQIQEEAYEQINAAYASSEKKNSYLGSRLDFYRSIISPESGVAGPGIQALTAEYENNELIFSLTLVQAIKHKLQIRGSLEVLLMSAGQTLAKWPEAGPKNVSFQYFQEITGAISAANIPENATIEATLTAQTGEKIKRSFAVKNLLTPNSVATN